jgi:hypothetical protein
MIRTLAVTVSMLLGASPAVAQWTRGDVGRAWVKTAAFWQRTENRFNELGERTVWFGSGESDARALFTDIIVGVHPSVDVWFQVPYFDLRFEDAADDLRTTGFGDIRGWIRWKLFDLGNGSTPVAIRAGGKAPIGSSPRDAPLIPVGDGQWDLEGFAEIGHSFWPFPAYGEIWLGYRARFANDEKLKDPGGEYVFLTEVGVNPIGGTLVKVTLDGFFGRNWISDRVVTATKRRIATLQFAAAVRTIGPLWTEGGIRLALAGRNFPAGPQLVLGVSSELDFFGR